MLSPLLIFCTTPVAVWLGPNESLKFLFIFPTLISVGWQKTVPSSEASHSYRWQFWADPLPLCPRLNYQLPPVTRNTLCFKCNLSLTSQSGYSNSNTSVPPAFTLPHPWDLWWSTPARIKEQQWWSLVMNSSPKFVISQWDLMLQKREQLQQQKYDCLAVMPRVIFDKSQG